jgi:hypothetical protein
VRDSSTLPLGKEPRYCIGGWMGATAGLHAVEKEKKILCLPGIESDSPVRI